MAESVATADMGTGLTVAPVQKRKRGAEPVSPDARRSKRAAPTAAMSSSDAATAAFIESAVHAHNDNHVNVDDFNALQAAAGHSEAADPANASSTAAAALGSMYPTLDVPQTTEQMFMAQSAKAEHHPDGSDASYNASGASQADALANLADDAADSSHNGITQAPRQQNSSNPKPAVGSEEWHKMRKDNHKEVERRRRELINEGINELAKIVPGCEKNKGSILQQAVAYIKQLTHNEQQNIEKWTLEKLLTEQALQELSQANEKLKVECDRLYRDLEVYKRLAQNAGQHPPKDETAGAST